jgi:hypothetical protein
MDFNGLLQCPRPDSFNKSVHRSYNYFLSSLAFFRNTIDGLALKRRNRFRRRKLSNTTNLATKHDSDKIIQSLNCQFLIVTVTHRRFKPFETTISNDVKFYLMICICRSNFLSMILTLQTTFRHCL